MSAIVWWEIETADPDRFQRFHSAMFGWTFEPAFADTALGHDYWIIVDGGRSIGGLQRAAGVPGVGARLYVEVDDLEGALEDVVRLGGSVERARTELGGDDRWFATFRDPTGISFGLWTPHPLRSTDPVSSGA